MSKNVRTISNLYFGAWEESFSKVVGMLEREVLDYLPYQLPKIHGNFFYMRTSRQEAKDGELLISGKIKDALGLAEFTGKVVEVNDAISIISFDKKYEEQAVASGAASSVLRYNGIIESVFQNKQRAEISSGMIKNPNLQWVKNFSMISVEFSKLSAEYSAELSRK